MNSQELAKFKIDYLNQLIREKEDIEKRILKIQSDKLSLETRTKVIKHLLKEKDFSSLNYGDYELVDKKCAKCNKIKTLNEFHKCLNGKYGRHGRCKECTLNK